MTEPAPAPQNGYVWVQCSRHCPLQLASMHHHLGSKPKSCESCLKYRSGHFGTYIYHQNLLLRVCTQGRIAVKSTWESNVALGTNWLNQCCFNIVCQRIVTWNLRGKYIGFEKGYQCNLLSSVLLRVTFQPQDYVIMVTKCQHRQTLNFYL
jgi:hypothetical protein